MIVCLTHDIGLYRSNKIFAALHSIDEM